MIAQRTHTGAGLRFAACAAFGALLAAAPARADESKPALMLAPDEGGVITSARFSPDGKSVVTTGAKPGVRVWDAKTGKAVKSFDVPGRALVTGASDDGKRAVGFTGNAVAVWELAIGMQLAEIKGHADGVLDAQISADGSRVATGSQDKTAKVWEAKTGKLVATLTGHTGPVASVRFSPDGSRVATGSYYSEIKVWDAKSGKEQLDLRGMSTSNNPTVFSADGKLLVSPRFESPAVWNAKDGKEVQEFKGHKGWCRAAAFDPAGGRIVSAGLDKTARVWDVKTGKTLHTLPHDAEVGSASFSPDGTRVLTLSGGKVRVWQLPAK